MNEFFEEGFFEDSIEIENDESECCVFAFDTFSIVFTDDEWLAIPDDEDNEDVIIIESEKQEIFMQDELLLFDNYVLKKEKFEDFKEAIKSE